MRKREVKKTVKIWQGKQRYRRGRKRGKVGIRIERRGGEGNRLGFPHPPTREQGMGWSLSGGYKEMSSTVSLLTNSALVIRVLMRGEEGSCGVSANEYSCAHHGIWSPNKLWRSTSAYLTYVLFV
jgi:hypothetical protein